MSSWVLLFALFSVAVGQPALPLLPQGVTIDQVTQIQVTTSGTVQFQQSTDGSSTIASRLPYTPDITFDSSTGILTVAAPVVSGAALAKPGLVAVFLALGLCFSLNPNRNTLFICLLFAGLGVATAADALPDVIIRVPGCFHTEGTGGNTLVFDTNCQAINVTAFEALPAPVAAVEDSPDWNPIDPATYFSPANDAGMHSLDPIEQYEVWRQTFGKPFDADLLPNFLAFTARCHAQNQDPMRSWTAGCNQFADQNDSDWRSNVLASNADLLSQPIPGRRLLGEHEEQALYSDLSDSHSRKLLQTTSFSWVGSGKLTPVKDQGQCGDCYAHSTSSQMEAAFAITMATVPQVLSREQLKDCSQGSPGCEGGVPEYMFNYAAGTQGLSTEALYPYNPTDQPCMTPSVPAMAYGNAGYNSITNTEQAFQVAVQQAPVAITVCADTWNNYAGGVFTNCATGCNVDHAVLLVGFGTDARLGDYWLIQNSWNTWWGESGFIRLPNTHSSTPGVGMCGMTTRQGVVAKSPKGTGAPSPATNTNCQGSWSAWSACSVTCGSGTQTQTWTTNVQPSGTGLACPNPTTKSQVCGTTPCPSPTPGGGGVLGNCITVKNSAIGASGNGGYAKTAGWNQNFCGTALNPAYSIVNANCQTEYLFWFTTNCMNGVPTAGQWGLYTATGSTAYQWSGSLKVTAGVIPGPDKATGWTISIATATTCPSLCKSG